MGGERVGDFFISDYKAEIGHVTTQALQWRHDGCEGVSNHQPQGCLLNRSFRRRSKKTSKFLITGLCVGNSLVTGEFPAQMASDADNVSIWWRHHVLAGLWHVFVAELCLIAYNLSKHLFLLNILDSVCKGQHAMIPYPSRVAIVFVPEQLADDTIW